MLWLIDTNFLFLGYLLGGLVGGLVTPGIGDFLKGIFTGGLLGCEGLLGTGGFLSDIFKEFNLLDTCLISTS